MEIRDLLESYYDGLTRKTDYESVLSDNFNFVGGDMEKQTPIVGKEKYKEVINRFSRLFTGVRVKEIITKGNSAAVIANYDYAFPNGKKINGNVAEIWRMENDKLCELTIFFDTLGFQNNLKT